MEQNEFERYLRLLHGKTFIQTKQSTQPSNELLLLGTILSSIIIIIFIIGLFISRYYHQRHKPVKSSSNAKHFSSRSCDHFPLSTQTFVNETTHIIKSSSSWPEGNMFSRQDQEQIQSSSSSQLEATSLTFSLRWDEKIKSLFVRVISARDLFRQKSSRQLLIIDSYVRIQLIPTDNDTNLTNSFPSMRTHIVKKNPHPIYDELFEFTNLEEISLENHSLIFTISTYDTFTRDEIIGEVIFPIQTTALDSTEMTFTQNLTPRHQQLSDQDAGQMLLSICYQPSDNSLTILALKATNLPNISTTRSINPYFKIYMFYKQQRIMKKRSTIKRASSTAIYNECFTFQIPSNDIENVYFDVILFNYDQHMKHEPIGIFTIGKELSQHWNDVCHRQITKQIAHWYQFKSFAN